MEDLIFQILDVHIAEFVEEIVFSSLLGGFYICLKLFKESKKNKAKGKILSKVLDELNDELIERIVEKLDDNEKKEIPTNRQGQNGKAKTPKESIQEERLN